MDGELRVVAKSIDPTLVGARVKHARVRAGLTQSDVAGKDVSTAYICRIEAGSRRASADLLDRLSGRLGTTVEELLAPEDEAPGDAGLYGELRLGLDFAELSLRTGSAAEALEGARGVAARARTTPGPVFRELAKDAAQLQALALEAQGSLDEAIGLLEDLATDETPGLRWITSLTALSRCYREAGDLSRAIEVGERAEGRLERDELLGTDEGIQLIMTVSGAHHRRGDVAHALRMCERAAGAAEALGSPMARAAVYWNSSLYRSSLGDVSAALPLARKAISLLESSSDARNLARLRTQIGLLQLQADPPQVEEALDNLRRSESEMGFTSASAADLGYTRMGLAKALFMSGDVGQAGSMADRCYDAARDGAPFVAADARVLQGQVAARQGDATRARELYGEAVSLLRTLGADRSAAELWYQLATLLEEIGAAADANVAYRGAAAASGLTSPLREAVTT